MTKEQLEAANERLGEEVAALRALLAAASELATVPMPADVHDVADWQRYLQTSERRSGLIAVYANPDCDGTPAMTATLRSSAEALRKEAARPLRYTPKGGGPAPYTGHLRTPAIPAGPDDPNRLRMDEPAGPGGVLIGPFDDESGPTYGEAELRRADAYGMGAGQ